LNWLKLAFIQVAQVNLIRRVVVVSDSIRSVVWMSKQEEGKGHGKIESTFVC
jgi:hypothetical protein